MPKSSLQPMPVEALQHADARWLLAYARSKMNPEGLLVSDTLVPAEARSVLHHLMVLEPTGKPEELRYVTVGDSIVARFGVDLTGRTLELGSPGGWAPAMREALAKRRPVALRGDVPGGQSSWARLEALILPVACAGHDGMGILAGLFFL